MTMLNDKKVAIIGSGIAGMHAAKVLATSGIHVEIFEKEAKVGGVIYTGIPDFRMPKTFIDKLENEIKEMGVIIHLNTTVGKDVEFDTLMNEFDRVLLAIGAQVENLFGFEECCGFESGLKLLYNLNVLNQHDDYKKKFTKAYVWGGGNVAMDCSRSLAHIIDDVTVIYRRSENEMPASKIEIRDAMNDGVKFAYLQNINDLVKDENGKVIGIDVVNMELGEQDESGRASCHQVEGSNHIEDCDLVVAAIGQKVNLTNIKEGMSVTDGHKLSLENAYIAGDAYLGPKTIGACMVDGKAAAKEIIDSFN